MTRKKPEFLQDLNADFIVILSDGDTWSELSGCSLAILPKALLLQGGVSLGGGEMTDHATARSTPYGLVALDVLLRRIPLKTIEECITRTDHVPPPPPTPPSTPLPTPPTPRGGKSGRGSTSEWWPIREEVKP